MSPPGDYIADASEGITRPEDLPAPRVERHSRNYPRRRCACCGHSARRYGVAHRRLHDLGDPRHDRPIDLILRQSKHRCRACRRCFLADASDLALPKSHYTLRVQRTAVRLVIEDGLPYRAASWHLWRDHRVFAPWPTIQNWVEQESLAGIDTEYLDRVLKTFSGYLAIDELYDGPFCVISVVDNRMYQRLAYRVLEKSPTKGDVHRFLREFAARLDSRGCRRITTDGSSLYPQALAKVFPGVPHQVCEFHVLKEITRAILHTPAWVRASSASQDPQAAARPAQPVSCESGPECPADAAAIH